MVYKFFTDKQMPHNWYTASYSYENKMKFILKQLCKNFVLYDSDFGIMIGLW